MKGKLAVLGFLCAAITVGGVYATWSFAEKDTTAANTTVNVAMTGLEGASEKGTLSVQVMGDNGFTLAVDDSDNNHLPEVKKTGVVKVTFTPSANASADVKANGIDVSYTITYAPYAGGAATLEEWTYDGTQIFTIGATVNLNKSAAVKNGDSFVWTIAADDVPIDLTEAMKTKLVDMKAKYDALNAELAKGHFVITVNELTGA